MVGNINMQDFNTWSEDGSWKTAKSNTIRKQVEVEVVRQDRKDSEDDDRPSMSAENEPRTPRSHSVFVGGTARAPRV